MLSSLADVMLTRDAKQRIRLAHSGLASALMVVAVMLMHAMTWLGVNDGRGLWPWTAVSAIGLVSMFISIRLGWSARLRDPSLTVLQLLYAVGCTAVAYRISGAGHGTPLLMLALVLMFGMFGLRRVEAWLVGACTIAAFGAAMYTGVIDRPDIYYPVVQAAYFVSLVLFVFGLMAVSGRVAAMRQRLRAQKTELAEAFDRLSLLATRDDLTGLLNRRAMAELLDRERQRSRPTGRGWSVAILDVDHFKRINDAHGHAAGDDALRNVARVCESLVRDCDAVSRWGGEEFVLLCRNVDARAAHAAAERIRARVEGTTIHAGDATFAVAVSIGVATYRAGDTVAHVLSRADEALYEAKLAGRNRVRAHASSR